MSGCKELLHLTPEQEPARQGSGSARATVTARTGRGGVAGNTGGRGREGAGSLSSAECWGHRDDPVEGTAVTALDVTEAQAL